MQDELIERILGRLRNSTRVNDDQQFYFRRNFRNGQVDRLAVTTDSILIADYKTNRPAPRKLDDVPPSYLGQLALYRAVLSRLYPKRSVRAALVWTEAPDLMELSATVMDHALAQLTSAS